MFIQFKVKDDCIVEDLEKDVNLGYLCTKKANRDAFEITNILNPYDDKSKDLYALVPLFIAEGMGGPTDAVFVRKPIFMYLSEDSADTIQRRATTNLIALEDVARHMCRFDDTPDLKAEIMESIEGMEFYHTLGFKLLKIN